ncbi:tRNA synthetases class II-domain-containing protein [Abortiporus biennis]|nr:tRNA synthetases class II-domain-containing protein [Abortiporus biennis]
MNGLNIVSSRVLSSTITRGALPRCLKSTFSPYGNIRNLSATSIPHDSPVNAQIQHRDTSLQAHCAPYTPRTHNCGALTLQDAGSTVILNGWLLTERKVNKKFSFFPLQDSYGTTQLVIHPDDLPEVAAFMRSIPPESTVQVEGEVHSRPPSQRRPVPAGEIEVTVKSMKLLNPADPHLPFMPSDTHNLANEDLRMRYRYLDLRRPTLSSNLKKRSKVAHIIRSVLHDNDFTEVETPILLKSTPEGAREYLVPTRLTSAAPEGDSSNVQPLFYALPQSPQQPKQLLIASGSVDRYYQIARCFRDEDGRKDRQPEFTQVDLEMAWVSWGDPHSPDTTQLPRFTEEWRIGGREVKDIIENLIRTIWYEVEGIELPKSFKIMSYEEAMCRFGSDKPDIRFGLEIQDITSRLSAEMKASLEASGEIMEAIIVEGSDKPFNRAAKRVQKTPLEPGVQFVKPDTDVRIHLGLSNDATIWMAKRKRIAEGGSTSLGRLRLALSSIAQKLGDLVLPSDPHFLWVTEFPLFTRADEDKEFLAHGRWSSSHHPFTAPMWQDVQKMYERRIGEVRGQHYDLVLNGMEIGGGSVRVHDAAMQEYIFSKVLQLDEKEKSSFKHLLHALKCGAPPHGGIALGFDRLMSILCKTESIRDVIAFPKTGSGTDLLFKSPAPVSAETLREYGIQQRNG